MRLTLKQIDDLAHLVLRRLNGFTETEIAAVLKRARQLTPKKNRRPPKWKGALGVQKLREFESGRKEAGQTVNKLIEELWKAGWKKHFPGKEFDETIRESIKRRLKEVAAGVNRR